VRTSQPAVADDKALLALSLLVEGNSLRSSERISGLDINTIMKILVHAGEKCEKVMAKLVRNVKVADVECDEIWGYVGKKEGHKRKLGHRVDFARPRAFALLRRWKRGLPITSGRWQN